MSSWDLPKLWTEPTKIRHIFRKLRCLKMTLFSEKVLISARCISGLMPNLIKKSWTDSILNPWCMYCTFFSPRSIFDLQTASNCYCNSLTHFLLRFRISLMFKIHLIQLRNQVLLQCLVCMLLMQLQAPQVKKINTKL